MQLDYANETRLVDARDGATRPGVSVVITTRNRPGELDACVWAILRQAGDEVEVVVVDQSDTWRGDAAWARDGRTRYVWDEQRGAARGRNLGMALARGEVIAITDDDCLAPDGWVERVAGVFAERPEVDVLFGAVDAPEHDYARWIVPIFLPREGRVEYGFGGRAGRLEGLSAHMALRRRVFERIGGFDARFGAGANRWSGEDFEFHFRALRSGAVVLIEPGIRVLHLGMRPQEEAWKLWRRDALGCGAVAALLVARGARGTALHMWWWHVGRVLLNACLRLVSLQWPSCLRMALWIVGHSAWGFVVEWRSRREGDMVGARRRAPTLAG